jgi:hypothetical protein
VQLEDLENMVLMQLQEANPNFGSQAVFASGANYNQAAVDFNINRAYAKTLADIGDIALESQVLKFPSVSQQYAYPVPIGAAASGTINTVIGTGSITGTVLTVTINGTPVTYTCASTDGALSALSSLVANVNKNTTLVVNAAPVITPVQQELNAASTFTIQAFTPGTAGNSITLTVSSSASTKISIAASGATLTGGTAASPSLRTLRRVYYQPLGLTYTLSRAPGVRLISWDDYLKLTVDGYLQYFSAGQFPDYVAMNTTRTKLHLYPTPYESGDTITFEYAPQLTNSASIPASNYGYLVNGTDVPLLPEDAQDLIWMYACYLLWPKSREIGTAQLYKQMYQEKLTQVLENYMQASQGASFGIRDKGDLLGQGYGFSNWFNA